jgi:hypothetical protein
MEITRPNDMGADLNAPSAARGGAATPGYALVAVVHPGNVIVHYDSRDEEITGGMLSWRRNSASSSGEYCSVIAVTGAVRPRAIRARA